MSGRSDSVLPEKKIHPLRFNDGQTQMSKFFSVWHSVLHAEEDDRLTG